MVNGWVNLYLWAFRFVSSSPISAPVQLLCLSTLSSCCCLRIILQYVRCFFSIVVITSHPRNMGHMVLPPCFTLPLAPVCFTLPLAPVCFTLPLAPVRFTLPLAPVCFTLPLAPVCFTLPLALVFRGGEGLASIIEDVAVCYRTSPRCVCAHACVLVYVWSWA